MKKPWGLTPKILSGKKKIESRWYKSKYPPWNRIKQGEILYFKDSGEAVKIKACVQKVLQFEDLDPQKVKELLLEFGKADGLEVDDIPRFYKMFKDKRYCILVFIKNPQRIEPFEIDKSGFGAMAAWLCVENVEKIKLASQ